MSTSRTYRRRTFALPVDLPPLPHEEQIDLFRIMHDSGRPDAERKEARETLILTNLKVCGVVATRYQGRPSSPPMEDILGYAMEGLAVAVDRFEWQRGWRFGTFGFHAVRNHVRNSIRDHEDMMKISSASLKDLPKMTLEEIDLHPIASAAYRAKRIVTGQYGLPRTQLMGSPLGCGQPPQDPAVIAEEEERVRLVKERVDRALSRLRPIQALVIRRRNGLDGNDPETLQSIGDFVGVTRERIRMIEKRAMPVFCRELGAA